MYTIKMEPKSGDKRRPQNQLTKDNQSDQSDDTQAGEFRKASSEQMKGRRIITPRRRSRTQQQQQQPRQPQSPKRSLPPQQAESQQAESFDDNRRVKRIKRNNNPRLIRNILKNLQHEAQPQPQAQIQQNQQNQLEL